MASCPGYKAQVFQEASLKKLKSANECHHIWTKNAKERGKRILQTVTLTCFYKFYACLQREFRFTCLQWLAKSTCTYVNIHFFNSYLMMMNLMKETIIHHLQVKPTTISNMAAEKVCSWFPPRVSSGICMLLWAAFWNWYCKPSSLLSKCLSYLSPGQWKQPWL